ncbi:hypothetical protein [Leifsonia virtsii]|uniref:Antitoxin Xre/MbcA/ParS-like toxin-binding domain-containing protein n=1 Tax=Leifsonia virtsii TaxID=3035915 RepID=A0ABT8IZ96_9MICO|nr:hypothetical protein [Leifsonia virtsii]MDN4598027.1 hypothetical protein [Leifsonia virtsii]
MTDVMGTVQLSQQWQRDLGPFLTAEQAARLLRLTVSDINTLARSLEILELRDSVGCRIYPWFTFDSSEAEQGELSIIAGLESVLVALARATDETWLWALWLAGHDPRHRGTAPVDGLTCGSAARVLEQARNEDWSWTSTC